MVHLHNGILCGHKKEGNLTFCNPMDGPGDYYAKQNKPVGERQIPHDLTYMWNIMKKYVYMTHTHGQQYGDSHRVRR